MAIGVTIGAAVELHFEEGVLPFLNVTLRALQAGMPALQGIGAGRVLLHRKFGRLPSLHGVALGALAMLGALYELPVVWIRLVAIRAFRKFQRLLEVTVGMALGAIDGSVLAFQRVLG